MIHFILAPLVCVGILFALGGVVAFQRRGGLTASRFGIPVAAFTSPVGVSVPLSPPWLDIHERDGRLIAVERQSGNPLYDRTNGGRPARSLTGEVSVDRRRVVFRTGFSSTSVCLVLAGGALIPTVGLASGWFDGGSKELSGVLALLAFFVTTLVYWVRSERARARLRGPTRIPGLEAHAPLRVLETSPATGP